MKTYETKNRIRDIGKILMQALIKIFVGDVGTLGLSLGRFPILGLQVT